MDCTWELDDAHTVKAHFGAFGGKVVTVNGREAYNSRKLGPKGTIPFTLPDGRQAVITVKAAFVGRPAIDLRVGGNLVVETGKTPINCAACGTVAKPYDRFCGKCGNAMPTAEDHANKKLVKDATGAIKVLAALFLIFGILMFFVVKSQADAVLVKMEGMEAGAAFPTKIEGRGVHGRGNAQAARLGAMGHPQRQPDRCGHHDWPGVLVEGFPVARGDGCGGHLYRRRRRQCNRGSGDAHAGVDREDHHHRVPLQGHQSRAGVAFGECLKQARSAPPAKGRARRHAILSRLRTVSRRFRGGAGAWHARRLGLPIRGALGGSLKRIGWLFGLLLATSLVFGIASRGVSSPWPEVAVSVIDAVIVLVALGTRYQKLRFVFTLHPLGRRGVTALLIAAIAFVGLGSLYFWVLQQLGVPIGSATGSLTRAGWPVWGDARCCSA